jgi:Transposase DDE domain
LNGLTQGTEGGESWENLVTRQNNPMSSPSLHRQLFGQLSQWISPKDKRHLQVFSEILGAMLMAQSACMSHWVPYLTHRNCQARSHLERLRYFLSNPEITTETFYEPVLKFFLEAWTGEETLLTFDTSMHWNKFCLIQVCIAWGGRSIPIAHEVIEHGSSSVSFEQYLPTLVQAQKMLPENAKVAFLADRGFDHGELMRWLNQAGWNWTIRLKRDILVTVAPGTLPCAVDELIPPENVAYLYPDVEILGDINCHLAVGHWSEANDVWAVATSTAVVPSVQTFDLYGKRFGGIEPFFKDHKSATFDLPKSRLRNAQALSCLFLLMATAQLLGIAIGFWLVRSKKRSTIDPHTNRGLSFLQLGLRQIQSLCYLQSPLPEFRAIPYYNPPPACASRRKKLRASARVRFPQVFEL